MVLQRGHREGLQVLAQHAVDFGAYGVRGVFALLHFAHRYHATGVDGVVGNGQFLGHAGVVFAGDESRVVVGDDACRAFSELEQRVIGISFPAAEMENVARPERFCAGGSVGDAFQNERVQPIVRLGIGAGEAFVDQQRQIALVSQVDGVGQGVVVARPTIHLRPVQDVVGVGTRRMLV